MTYRYIIIAIVAAFLIGCEDGSSISQQSQSAPPPETEQTSTEVAKVEQDSEVVPWPFSMEDHIAANPVDKLTNQVTDFKLDSRNFFLIFDGSGSMEGDRLAQAKKSAQRWISKLPLEDNLGLIAFENGPGQQTTWTLHGLSNGESNRINGLIQNVTAGDGTPLGEAVKHAFLRLSEQGLRQLGYGHYEIVVLSDGDAGDKDKLHDWMKYVTGEFRMHMTAIAFQDSSDTLAGYSGLINYMDASNSEELDRALDTVLAEASTISEDDF